MWRCEVTQELVATQTACDVTPSSGSCPGQHEVTVGVDLPYVDVDGGYTGWLVYTHPGMLEGTVSSPTQNDIERVMTRCISACVREYEYVPHISANCNVQDGFETPTAVVDPVTSARQAIPPAHENGAGIWSGQSLSCSLLDECCAALDEDVCPAVPYRLTANETQLGRGQEWVVDVVGEIKTYSFEDDTYGQADIVGTLGWSFCAAGDSSGSCPFYLGSAHFESTEQMLLNLQCNGNWVQRPVDVFELDLLQPAMGMDVVNDVWIAFPPGSLISRMHAESGPFSFDLAGPNEIPVYLKADDDYMQLQPTGGLEILFDYNCDGDIKPIKAWVQFDSSTTQESPPSISIDMPSSVSCSSVVPLDAIVDDPDADAGAVRWQVDGVLLHTSVGAITVTETLEIVAKVRDARGATATDTHTITCT